MTLQIGTLSSTLQNLSKSVDFSAVEQATQDAISQFEAIKNTTLGSIVGEIKGGIEALTQEIDDAESALKSNFVPTIARVTSDIEGLADQLVGNVPGAIASDIQAITGTATAAANGVLNEIISAASPEAIDTALKKVTDATTAQLQSTLSQIADANLTDFIQTGLTNTPFGELLNSTSIFVNQINTALGANSQFFLVDFGEKLERQFQTSVNSLLGTVAKQSDIDAAFSFVANGDYASGFDAISRYIPLPENYYAITAQLPQSEWPADILEAYDRLNNARGEFETLNVELSSYVNQFDPSANAAGRNTQPVRTIGQPPFQSSGAQTGGGIGATSDGDSWDFTDIKSVEELEALFRSITRPAGREIVGAVIHWSATFLNQNIGAEWIHDLHIRERGFKGIGYHIVIRRDGTLQRGRPMNLEGAHDENNNSTFLGFCFVGGLNTTSNNAVEPLWKYASADSLTPAQYNSYDQLMRTFHQVFPHAQVAGHYMTSNDGKVDPGFDVVGYSYSKFNHVNVIPEGDPIWKSRSVINLDTLAQYAATS